MAIRSMVWTTIVFAAATVLANAQRICRGQGQVPIRADRPFEICTDYSGSQACMVPSGEVISNYPSETDVVTELTSFGSLSGPGSEQCRQELKQLLCSGADPWSYTFFGAGPIPRLCTSHYAAVIWESCSQVTIERSPFSAPAANASLADLFVTQDNFMSTLALNSPEEGCYSGVPVDDLVGITPDLEELSASGGPDDEYTGQICVERLNFDVDPNDPFVTATPLPQHPSLLAISTQAGVVSLFNMIDDIPTSNATQFLNLKGQILLKWNAGLFGMAFHKDFNSNGRLFIAALCKEPFNCKNDGDLVVSEYHVKHDGVSLDTAVFVKEILYVETPFSDSNGGQLLFSPSPDDPYLYIVVGDGADPTSEGRGDTFNAAQDLSVPLGKILRVDIDSKPAPGKHYVIPTDNPLINVEGAMGEIYAYGFREPWRCSFDRGQPKFLFCGDVGQDLWEEIDRVVPGANYGWPRYEGSHDYNLNSTQLKDPIVFPQMEYSHASVGAGGRSAIMGGFVYRPQKDKKPSCIDGTYFFGDLYRKIFSANEVAPGSGLYKQNPGSGQWECSTDSPTPCGNDLGLIYSLFEDNAGEVFVSASNGMFHIVEPSKCNRKCFPK